MSTSSKSAGAKKAATAKRMGALPDKPTKSKTIFISQTEAKNKFLAHCRHVINSAEVVCVKDQSNEPFLVLTSRPVKGPYVTVSSQFFKDHFARCSSLIRDGLVFSLTLRGSSEAVFARRHTAYRDPLDGVIEQWCERIADAAAAGAGANAIAQLARDFAATAARQDRRQDEAHAELLEGLKRLATGITRLSIGHRPFEEGTVQDQRFSEPRPH